jgi:hypothetical protein
VTVTVGEAGVASAPWVGTASWALACPSERPWQGACDAQPAVPARVRGVRCAGLISRAPWVHAAAGAPLP